jgi:hypothetical protein
LEEALRSVFFFANIGHHSAMYPGGRAFKRVIFSRRGYCAPLAVSPFPQALRRAASSGTAVVVPPMSFYPGVFFLVDPVYRGAAPVTAAQRQAELSG